MDPINNYSDVIVISDDDDDDAVNSEFKDKDNLGGKDNHLMPKKKKTSNMLKKNKASNMPKKKKYHHFIKTEIDVFDDYVWKSIIEISLDKCQLPDNSIITQKSITIKKFHCHYCEKYFPEEDLLKEHLKTHKQLQNTNKNITCQFCGKLICFKFQLNRQAFRKTCNCEAISIN